MIARVLFVVAALATDAAAQSVTLPDGAINATVMLEIEASAGAFGEATSVAPDLSYGATSNLTLSLVHSTFARTGFRGVAGAGLCIGDACPAGVYDNAGLEATYSVRRGTFAAAANAGVHATSIDRTFYAAKLGAKLRWQLGRITIVSIPSVLLAVTERDAMTPNRDRMLLPVAASFAVTRPFALGIGTGYKVALHDIDGTSEMALGAFATFSVSPALAFGTSWIHGKLVAGDASLPDGASGVDFRALHFWISATR